MDHIKFIDYWQEHINTIYSIPDDLKRRTIDALEKAKTTGTVPKSLIKELKEIEHQLRINLN